jgi:nucleotide-binding universal stress UspA family protein
MSHSPGFPAPIICERDNDGRLVGLAFDSVPPMATPEANPWLVAVDGSENALRAVAHALQQAHEMNICALHLVHVQPWLSREAAEAELAHRAWHVSERARALLDAQNQPWRLHVVMGEVAEGILHLAIKLRCSGIVIGRRGLGTTEGLLFGSITSKLMQLGGPPLAVVP